MEDEKSREVNILVWIIIFGYLNCSSVLKRKCPSHCLSPSICAKETTETSAHPLLVCYLLTFFGGDDGAKGLSTELRCLGASPDPYLYACCFHYTLSINLISLS